MADVEIGRNEVGERGLRLEIEVEGPGFVETVKVEHPAEPGSVARAVQRVLRDLGLTAA